MVCQLGLSFDDAFQLTMKQLQYCYEVWLLEEWDKTALLATLISNLITLTGNINSKTKAKPKKLTDIHPYRNEAKKENIITPKNINNVKMLVNAILLQKQG